MVETAIEHIERDHGGCESNTCTIGVALRNGYNLVAIDHWIGSGAIAPDFPTELDCTLEEIQAEHELMTAELPHVTCPSCDSVLWLPEEAGWYCDNCAKPVPKV